MIRHLVFFRARDPMDLPRMRQTLMTLAGIDGVRGFEVGVNEQRDEGSDDDIDLVVHAVFDDAEALVAYKASPIYQRSVALVRPLREVRIAVDYEVVAPAPPAPAAPSAPSAPAAPSAPSAPAAPSAPSSDGGSAL